MILSSIHHLHNDCTNIIYYSIFNYSVLVYEEVMSHSSKNLEPYKTEIIRLSQNNNFSAALGSSNALTRFQRVDLKLPYEETPCS